ncbi:hypothetical protein, partial [Pseudomonas aeruginosa]|uniref:hypothetical protein n=1 Tax=Pseudomonas aeruginosa TaxID=287 RepID=UPI002E1DC679|nr:hypothetical protein [Pseudomonas aeruginosa]
VGVETGENGLQDGFAAKRADALGPVRLRRAFPLPSPFSLTGGRPRFDLADDRPLLSLSGLVGGHCLPRIWNIVPKS